MKKSVKGLIAAFAAVSILTACSPSTNSTTAASDSASTTAQDSTGTTTTPPETGQVTIPSTTPSTTAGGTTTASSTDNGRMAEVMNRSTAVMAALESYRVTVESTFGSAEEGLTSNSVMDIYPQLGASIMTAETFGTKMVSYTVEDTVYTKMPDGTWTKMRTTTGEPGEETPPLSEAEYAELFVMEETAEGYRIKTRSPITMEELQRIGNIPPEETDVSGLGEDEADVSVEMEMLINGDYHTSATVMTMLVEADGETIKMTMTSAMSHFNELPAFELPPEAEAAEEMEIPGMP